EPSPELHLDRVAETGTAGVGRGMPATRNLEVARAADERGHAAVDIPIRGQQTGDGTTLPADRANRRGADIGGTNGRDRVAAVIDHRNASAQALAEALREGSREDDRVVDRLARGPEPGP